MHAKDVLGIQRSVDNRGETLLIREIFGRYNLRKIVVKICLVLYGVLREQKFSEEKWGHQKNVSSPKCKVFSALHGIGAQTLCILLNFRSEIQRMYMDDIFSRVDGFEIQYRFQCKLNLTYDIKVYEVLHIQFIPESNNSQEGYNSMPRDLCMHAD